MKKKLLFLSQAILFTPLFAISCSKNNFNTDKFHFIEKNNFANDYGDFSYLKDNHISKNINKINLATSAKLIRVQASQQPLIDFRDNIVLNPSELSYKFEWANKITVENKDKTFIFTNDNTDFVNYNEKKENNKNQFFPKKDKGNGFDNPYLFVPSSNENSINHKDFQKSLLVAKSITFSMNEQKNVWIDYYGNLTNKNNLINIKSFKLGLLAKMLRNKNFREEFAKKNNISLDKYREIHLKIDGFDLYNYLKNLKIDVEKLLDFNSDNLVLKTVDNSYTDLNLIFQNLFIIKNYFDAIPYEIIKNQFDIINKNLNWFFNYGKDYKNRFFASSYYIQNLNNKKTVLKLNPFYKKNNEQNLRQITIEYNLLPISYNTFSLQSVNAFKQNIISKINYENLNINEKEHILKEFNKYNFSYQKNYNRFKLRNNLIINTNPKLNSPYMNLNFLKIFYGLNKKNEFKLTKNNLIFQSLFNNLINQYSIINDSEDVWLSQAPENLVIKAKNDVLNINELKDSFNQISKPIILDINNKKFNNTFQFQNQNKLLNPKIISNEEKIKSFWFKKIKENLVKLIDEFYLNQNNSEDIFVNIPIFNTFNNQFINEKINLIKQTLNSIHNKLKIQITLIDNYEKYNDFFKLNKSIYKEIKFNLFEGNTIEYLKNQILNKDINLDFYSKFIFLNKNFYKNIYPQLIKIQEFNHINKLNLVNLELFLSNLTVEDQLSLINEINNLISYTISFNNSVNISSFSKIVFQKHFIKPLSWNNLNYFQDIKVIGGENENQ
ncbi:OppA family ABC transporter substrate-binding lipoprotein [Metamycoplasma canadense]|uniref:Lipoprotein n=1 Tax=Metamycoplasma canadense TaxID=29554 RepID=A0A077LCI7_9BACT|nr:hypothetical protein [Metamycoplasma canadense]BAP39794.1 hypothetical protein MCAN360_0775 [Metamycoplasma canadense]